MNKPLVEKLNGALSTLYGEEAALRKTNEGQYEKATHALEKLRGSAQALLRDEESLHPEIEDVDE